MLYLVIGLILLIILIIAYSTWRRRKTYGEIDRTDARRTEMANRPLANELAKVKELKMAGETEKNFEKWRSDWDGIVTADLPSIEESLFEAEELTDKYRFKKAEHLIKDLNEKMDKIDLKINEILKELNTVIESESKNREDITPIKESYHRIKKLMITRRSQFREALPLLEEKVKQIDGQYQKYSDETDSGNYIEARDVLLRVKTAIDTVDKEIERVPDLYEDIRQTIPDQLRELRQGKAEMEEQGYSLEHLQIDTQLEETDKQLQVLEEAVGRLELDQTGEGLKGIHDQLDWLYGQLEKEVSSRKQVIELAPEVEAKLGSVGEQLQEVSTATESFRESYHINEEDLNAQREIGRTYQKLKKGYYEADDLLKKHTEAFSEALEQLKAIRTDIENVESLTAEFDEKIKTLRKDETAARETIRKLRHSLFETGRMIRQSNIPGVPQSFAAAMDQAGEHLKFVDEKLDEKPLNMANVQEALNDAAKDTEDVRDQAQTLVDTASLAEEMIRYGNRYRSTDPQIDSQLKEAEKLFRNYDYRASAETAVKAVERKEPKIMKRFDLYQEHQA
ncbi:septation ring formation regulator EzrA [Sporolactobacillus shoreae]|uniref:Septation ring formation regulator EzrA n=1 Tax=Sporolactobacillus shoreae TaxID=1465501 RepID=A0A4Z0GRK7_9BACL|nr:septation ring formation regulator EzrA [Sporolactobacillus shoreae]TGA99238.1 septation ring formation regulator EzrA [Sporolactobacillus shoreae]